MIEGDYEREEEGGRTRFRHLGPIPLGQGIQNGHWSPGVGGIDIGAPGHWGWRGLRLEAGLRFLTCWPPKTLS